VKVGSPLLDNDAEKLVQIMHYQLTKSK
jgi:hypothetical protein